jgi:hypothetical protein
MYNLTVIVDQDKEIKVVGEKKIPKTFFIDNFGKDARVKSFHP